MTNGSTCHLVMHQADRSSLTKRLNHMDHHQVLGFWLDIPFPSRNTANSVVLSVSGLYHDPSNLPTDLTRGLPRTMWQVYSITVEVVWLNCTLWTLMRQAVFGTGRRSWQPNGTRFSHLLYPSRIRALDLKARRIMDDFPCLFNRLGWWKFQFETTFHSQVRRPAPPPELNSPRE